MNIRSKGQGHRIENAKGDRVSGVSYALSRVLSLWLTHVLLDSTLSTTRRILTLSGFFSGTTTISTNLNRLRWNLYSAVYVTSDGHHALVDWQSFLLFTSGQPGTIPCRPTHPDVNVMLTKLSRSYEVVPLSDNLAFHRRTGFHVRRASSYFNGYFKCLASFDDFTSQQTVFITYKGTSPRQRLFHFYFSWLCYVSIAVTMTSTTDRLVVITHGLPISYNNTV